MLDLIVKLLKARLELRWSKQPPGTGPSYDDVRYISRIFRKATQSLKKGENWAEIGRTLRMFAAGELKRVVSVVRKGRHQKVSIIVSEPNSYFIFLFAEFGFAALDFNIDEDMWSALMPDLIKMQAYYIERFSKAKRCITRYEYPAYDLTRSQQAVIDKASFSAPNPDRATLELRMYEILQDAGNCFMA